MSVAETLPITILISLRDEVSPRLGQIISSLRQLGAPISVPITPETKRRLDELGRKSAELNRLFKELEPVFSSWNRQVRRTEADVTGLTQAIEQGKNVAREYRAATYLVARQLGSLGLGARTLLRDIFWLGLGTMFVIMAFARFRRLTFAIERSIYSVRRSYRALQRAQEHLNETIREHGPYSQEAEEASWRLQDAIWQVRIAEESARMAIEQKNWALLMFVFGTVPTVIRATTDLATNMLRLAFIQALRTAQTEQEAISMIRTAGITDMLKWSIFGLTGAMFKAYLVSMLLTGGFMLLVGAIGYLYAQMQMAQLEERFREMREEMGLTEYELTGGSLVSALNQLGEAFEDVRIKQRRLGMLWRRGELGRVGLRTSIRTLTIGNLTINAVVRSRRDIEMIRREIESIYYTTSRTRGEF